MSTTAPAEIEIPRKFLPAFVVAANLDVMGHAEGLGNALSLDYTHEGRVQDDAKLATLTASIQMGAALLQAFDDKRGRVPRSLAQSTRQTRSATFAATCETPSIATTIRLRWRI